MLLLVVSHLFFFRSFLRSSPALLLRLVSAMLFLTDSDFYHETNRMCECVCLWTCSLPTFSSVALCQLMYFILLMVCRCYLFFSLSLSLPLAVGTVDLHDGTNPQIFFFCAGWCNKELLSVDCRWPHFIRGACSEAHCYSAIHTVNICSKMLWVSR